MNEYQRPGPKERVTHFGIMTPFKVVSAASHHEVPITVDVSALLFLPMLGQSALKFYYNDTHYHWNWAFHFIYSKNLPYQKIQF